MRLAVVGHVEWIEFVRGDHVPVAGEIVHADHSFEEPAGGGAVAAVQLARLAGEGTFLTAVGGDGVAGRGGGPPFLTAVGEDELARRARARLAELGVTVRGAKREAGPRRGLTFL